MRTSFVSNPTTDHDGLPGGGTDLRTLTIFADIPAQAQSAVGSEAGRVWAGRIGMMGVEVAAPGNHATVRKDALRRADDGDSG